MGSRPRTITAAIENATNCFSNLLNWDSSLFAFCTYVKIRNGCFTTYNVGSVFSGERAPNGTEASAEYGLHALHAGCAAIFFLIRRDRDSRKLPGRIFCWEWAVGIIHLRSCSVLFLIRTVRASRGISGEGPCRSCRILPSSGDADAMFTDSNTLTHRACETKGRFGHHIDLN